MRKFNPILALSLSMALGLAAAACGNDDISDAASSAAADATATTVKVTRHAQLGDILVDAKGITLYLFTRDASGESTCYDSCATSWPALTVTGTPVGGPGAPGNLATTDRTDGSKQVTYDGKQLYYFANDWAPGEAQGQNVGSVWFAVNARGEKVTAPAVATATAAAIDDRY